MKAFHIIMPGGMARSVAAVLATWLSVAMAATAEEFNRGQALYENHCQFCHANWAHSREGRVVTSYVGLRIRVKSWSEHSGLAWSDEDIDAVTRYLNQRFYRLPNP